MKLPDFFVTGSTGGNKNIFSKYLCQHPDIHLSEYEASNLVVLDRTDCNEINERQRMLMRYDTLFKHARENEICGEINEGYAITPPAAKKLHQHFPKSRIIMLIRNPLARIWSHYLTNVNNGKVKEKNFIAEINTDYLKAEKGWGITNQYLELGLYHAQIERLQSNFPLDQIKVVLYEELMNKPDKVLRDLFRFLEVDDNYKVKIETEDFNKSVNRKKTPNNNKSRGCKDLMRRMINTLRIQTQSRKTRPMNSTTLTFLKEFYMNDIVDLSNLLNIDLDEKWQFTRFEI